MTAHKPRERIIQRIRVCLGIMIAGLVVSGATAIPLEAELHLLAQITNFLGLAADSGLSLWLANIQTALRETNAHFPFMAYGTDWLGV